MGRPNTVEDFWTKVDKTDTCWLWTGKPTSAGYGVFSFGGKQWLAHKFGWYLETGEVWSGHETEIDHLCRVKMCVRPSHLERVTHSVNILRAKPFSVYASRVTCRNGHVITPETSVVRQQGTSAAWRCRLCDNEKARRYRSR